MTISDNHNRTAKLEATLTIVEISIAANAANCYIVAPGSTLTIKAVEGNSTTELDFNNAALVWQDALGMVKSVSANSTEKVVVVQLNPGIAGNAVVAAKLDDVIVWSWHVWVADYDPMSDPFVWTDKSTGTSYTFMDRNLGAKNAKKYDAGALGLLYQWGRKDPFPAAPTLTGTTATVGAPIYDGDDNEIKITNSSQSSTADNNLAFAIANPTVCLSNYAQFNTSRDWLQADMSNDALWGNPKGAERNETNDFLNKGAKSFYDPCPVGWRVPPADVFRNFTASGGYAWVIDDFDIADISGDGAKSLADYDYGWTFNLSDSASSYFPAAARFDGSYAMLMGSMSGLWGSYWGNAPYPGDMFQGGAYSVLSFQIKDTAGNEMITTSPAGGGARADAYSVRCIRE